MPTVETNGIKMYYEDYGDGQPIVVLHGATANHQVWAEQLQPLTDDYRVILYDLRGHGKTGGSDLDRYTVDTYGDDLAVFVDALDLDHPVVLGHSLGGIIGYRFADEHPEKLSALITVGAMTPESFSTGERAFKFAHSRVVMPLMGNEWVLDGAVWVQQKLFGDNSTPDMDRLEELREAHECETSELPTDERSKIMRAGGVADGVGRRHPARRDSHDHGGVGRARTGHCTPREVGEARSRAGDDHGLAGHDRRPVG